MRYDFFIAFRYLKAKKANIFMSRISLIGVFIVSIAIFLPLLTMSIMNGFHDSIIEKHINKDYHIQIRKDSFYNYAELMDDISNSKIAGEIDYIVPFYMSEGLLRRGDGKYFGVIFKGSGPKFYEEDLSFSKHFPVLAGSYSLDNFSVVIGEGLARLLNPSESSYRSFLSSVRDGKGPVVHFLVSSSSPSLFSYDNFLSLDKFDSGDSFFSDSSRLSIFKLKVGGIFRSGYLEYDNYLVFSNLKTAQLIYDARVRINGERNAIVSGIGIKLFDRDKARFLQRYLQSSLSGGYSVSTWQSRNKHLLYAFEWEDTLMAVILSLMVFVSIVITIYINLNIIVMDKRREIGILRSFGVSSRVIERIFTIEGFLIGFLGSILGSIFSILFMLSLIDIIIWFEGLVNAVLSFHNNHFGDGGLYLSWEFFSGGLGHLRVLLYRLEFWDLYMLVFLCIFISVSASYFSAKSKAKELISVSLRYE